MNDQSDDPPGRKRSLLHGRGRGALDALPRLGSRGEDGDGPGQPVEPAGRPRGSLLGVARRGTLDDVSTSRADLEAQLAEVERRLATGAALWQREWATMILRGIVKTLAQDERGPRQLSLLDRVSVLQDRLRDRDEEELGPARARLAAGQYSPDDLRLDLSRRPHFEHDAFTERLFGIDQVPLPSRALTDEMVHYLPSPLQVILELVAELGPEDVLFDLGSGLGKVAMLAAWLSPAAVVGVDLEPRYVELAAERARRFAIPRLRWLAADAREVDYSSGTVFFFYDPFRGEILDSVLAKLAEVARVKPVRVAARGRTTEVLDHLPWLTRAKSHASGLVIYTRAQKLPG